MENRLREAKNELAQLDYRDWLKKTIDELNGELGTKIFSLKRDPNDKRIRLIIDIHSFAYQIARRKDIRLPLSKDEKTYRATVNMTTGCQEVFKDKIQEIKTALLKILIVAIKSSLSPEFDGENSEELIDKLIGSMLTPLAALPQESSLFTWDFPRMPGLSTQELTLESEFDTPTIRSHKITIEISSATRFRESILTALEGYVRVKMNDESDEPDYVIQNVITNLELIKTNSSNELSILEKLINQETLGRLKREAEINYLENWAKVIGDDSDEAWELSQKTEVIYEYKRQGEENPHQISVHEASFYFRDYSRRIRLLEKFINDPKKPDSYYDLTYQGVTVNIRDLLSRRDAFSELPIVGQIHGCIGETDDPHRGISSITFGLKFKLNGRVNNPVSYPSSFAYGLDIINPKSELYKQELNEISPEERKRQVEKIIKFFILYYFAFACPNPLEANYRYEDVLQFDVIRTFTEKLLPILSQTDSKNDAEQQKKIEAFVWAMNKYLVPQKLEAIALTLKKYLKKEKFFVSDEKQLNIGLSKKLLLSELSEISDKGRFFGDELYSDNLKQCLKYVFISPQGVTKDAIIQLPVKLKFEIDNFYRAGKKCEFDMAYQIGNIQLLPMFCKFVQNDEKQQFQRDKINIRRLATLLRRRINLPTTTEEASDLLSRIVFPGSLIEFKVKELALEELTDGERFIYELTFKTLGFVIIESLTARLKQNKNLFIGQWILHETKEDQTTQQETAIHKMIEEWSHILNDFMSINSQGIVLPKIDSFRIQNAKKSLYSVLPQEYRSKNNDKRILKKLLIVMVSSNKCDARSSRWGENYIANLTGEIVAVEETDTGVKVSRVKTLAGNYSSDELHRCPAALRDAISVMYNKGFRDVLYVAKTPFSEQLRVTDQQNELFFMSPQIIKFIKNIANALVIYPVLYDSYSALRIDGQANEETLYVQDVRQLTNVFNDPNRSQIIFFNLLTGKTIEKDRTFYNTVTTYSTLLNAHPGDVLDVNKVMDGLINEGQLKDDIMFYLTAFHYSKYEKKETRAEKLLPKLDPLNDIIGDNAIGRLSARGGHCIPGVQINHLAFLTEVYNALGGSRPENNEINSVNDSSQSLLLLLNEIEDYLVNHQVIDPATELPKNYIVCLVECYANPIFMQRVNSILKNQGWIIENGVVEVLF